MQILLISGFLGAGKTHFIQELIKKSGRQFVIVENEFGEVGIDGPLLKKELGTLEDLKLWELTEGCICCSTNLDFTHSVLTIANTLDPDYLLIEPSGVAYLSRILNQLKQICYEKISLLAPLTIVDSMHYKESQKKFPEYFKDQVQHTGTILLSKSEHLSQEDFLSIFRDLNLEEQTAFPLKHYSQWSPEEWKSIFEKEIHWLDEEEKSASFLKDRKETKNVSETEKESVRQYRILVKKKPHKEGMESIGLEEIYLETVDDLVVCLNLLISGVLGKIARAKGYMKLSSEFIRFDLVEGTYTISGTEEMNEEKVIVIGKNLERSAIKKLFQQKKKK